MVGRCQLKPDEIRVESAWWQHLNLTCDKLLSNFAFDFNLRPYTLAAGVFGSDAVRPGRYSCHIIQRTLNPRRLSQVAPYDRAWRISLATSSVARWTLVS